MNWVISVARSRLSQIPGWAVVLITAAAVGAVSASIAVMALGRVKNRVDELPVESEVQDENPE
jgi:hypothetical protein